jgi:hypothetical protein
MAKYRYENKDQIGIAGLPGDGPDPISDTEIKEAIAVLYPEQDTAEIFTSLVKRGYYVRAPKADEAPAQGDATPTKEG